MKCPLCNFSDSIPVITYDEYPIYIKPIPFEYRDKVPLAPLIIKLCKKCDFVFQEVVLDIDEIHEIYDTIYESYHSPVISGIGSSLAHDFLNFLEQNINLDNKDTFEIGCYDGYFLSLMRDKHSCNVLGCDPSPGNQIAKTIGIEVIDDYFSPEFFHKTFEIIILRGVLEHVINPISFLKNVGEVLSINGIIAIEVPNVKYSLKNRVIGDFYHEHISYFAKNSLINCLNLSGFETIKIDDTGYYIQAIFRKSELTQDNIIGLNGPPSEMKQLFREYNLNAERIVSELNLFSSVISDKDLYIYGGGGHTIGLLSKMNEFIKPIGVIDGDPAKEGKFIPGFKIPVFPKRIIGDLDLENSIIIISSKIFQDEIANELKQYVNKGLKLLKLYPKVYLIK